MEMHIVKAAHPSHHQVVNNSETVSSATITRSGSKIHNISPKEPERT